MFILKLRLKAAKYYAKDAWKALRMIAIVMWAKPDMYIVTDGKVTKV